MEKCVVREAVQADLNEIIKLLDRDLSSYLPSNLNYSLVVDNCNYYRIVAEYDKKIVGYASLLTEVNARGGKLGHIEDVVVSKDSQGKGVGKRLIAAIEVEAKKRGCYKVGLASSISAEGFYESNGYVNSAKYYIKFM